MKKVSATGIVLALKAIDDLIVLVEDETGANDVCVSDPDSESVATTATGPVPMTFGHVRQARFGIDYLKGLADSMRAELGPQQ
jgi:hypothetical protein